MSLRRLLGLGGPARSDTLAPPGASERPLIGAEGIGFYGKVPTQADFLRINAGGFATGGFDRWLEDGAGALHAAGGSASLPLVTFFAYSATAANGCMGLVGPSRDKVGRNFPAALFAYLDPSLTGLSAFAGDALGAFLFPAQALVAGLEQAEVAPDLTSLMLPDAATQQAAAEAAGQQLARSGLSETLDLIFGPADPQAREHALAKCIAACMTARGRFPEKTSVTLELPAADDRARDFWLALIHTVLAWPQGAPTWLWDDRADRLLVALGPPSPSLFLGITLPDWVGSRHWIIRPNMPETSPTVPLPASASAAIYEPGATVASLLDGIASETST